MIIHVEDHINDLKEVFLLKEGMRVVPYQNYRNFSREKEYELKINPTTGRLCILRDGNYITGQGGSFYIETLDEETLEERIKELL